ncbi:MAG: adenylate/guanylate cyclase domain-containing protein [Candidatus Rokubacteria bacterium]|nr:adenylate/guanylate cyclase domain-containing protein [Candidatus Rokubacteria bacterium]
MSEERRQLATIMFTDVVGYSALTQKNEALALTLLDEQRRLLRALFAEHRGREIEAVGDGFFVEFGGAPDGARCAVAIQQKLFERNSTRSADQRIQVRIGLHLADVVHRENRVHGDGVNIAARIEPLAEAGGICLSEDVARQVQNKLELPLRKLGKGDRWTSTEWRCPGAGGICHSRSAWPSPWAGGGHAGLPSAERPSSSFLLSPAPMSRNEWEGTHGWRALLDEARLEIREADRPVDARDVRRRRRHGSPACL